MITSISRKVSSFATGVVLAVASVGAFADGTDYSAVTGAVDATSIVAAIGAIAGIMMLPRVAKWGFRTVMSMLGR